VKREGDLLSEFFRRRSESNSTPTVRDRNFSFNTQRLIELLSSRKGRFDNSHSIHGVVNVRMKFIVPQGTIENTHVKIIDARYNVVVLNIIGSEAGGMVRHAEFFILQGFLREAL